MLYRDELIDLRYRVATAEWERQKQFWAHNYAAKRLDVESEEWYRALQDEEAEFERQHPHRTKRRRWGERPGKSDAGALTVHLPTGADESVVTQDQAGQEVIDVPAYLDCD